MRRPTKLGVLGGSLTSLSMLFGYYGVAIITGETGIPLWDFPMIGAEKFKFSTLEYHVLVLGVPAFLATFVGVLVGYRSGLHSRLDESKIVGGNILVPFCTAFLAFLVGVVYTTVTWFVSGVVNAVTTVPPGGKGVILGVFGLLAALALAAMAFMFSVLFGGAYLIMDIYPILIPTVASGTLLGYGLARGLNSVWQNPRRTTE